MLHSNLTGLIRPDRLDSEFNTEMTHVFCTVYI